VWVKEYQFRVFPIWVEHADKIERFVILASSYPAGGFEVEHSLQTVEILRLDRVEAQSDWYRHEATVAFLYFLMNLVKEHIAIVAHNNAEV